MNYKFLLLSIFIITTAFQCDPEIRDNQRSVISGRVLDINGNPISNLNVIAEATSFVVGNGTTDPEGKFHFTSLQSANSDLKITINNFVEVGSYSGIIINYENIPFKNTYTIDDIILRKVASLDFKILKTSATNDTLTWSLKYIDTTCNRSYFENTSGYNSNCYEERIISVPINELQPNYEETIFLVKNSTAIFTYQINDGEIQSIPILLSEDNNTYEFEY